MKNICGPSSEEWNRMSNEEKEDFKQSYEDINNFAEKVVKEDELLKSVDSKKGQKGDLFRNKLIFSGTL